MARQEPEFKQNAIRIREFLIKQVREHEAIWDTNLSSHLKTSTVLKNDWLQVQLTKCQIDLRLPLPSVFISVPVPVPVLFLFLPN
jgi:hypothetical protein